MDPPRKFRLRFQNHPPTLSRTRIRASIEPSVELLPAKSAQPDGPRCGHGVRTGRASSKPSGLLHMKTNISLSDRAIRLFVGLTLLGLGTALDTPWGLLGVILMLTAAIGFCPL